MFFFGINNMAPCEAPRALCEVTFRDEVLSARNAYAVMFRIGKKN